MDNWDSNLWSPQEDSAEHASELPHLRDEESEGSIHQLLSITQQSQFPGLSVLPVGKPNRAKSFKREKISSVFVKKQKMWQFGDSECQGALGCSVTLSVTPS